MSIYVKRTMQYGVLVVFGVVFLFPFVWMVFTSLKPEKDIVTFPPTLFPHHWTFANYTQIWSFIPLPTYFVNTLLFAGTVTIVSLVFDSMSAYAFARLEFRGKNVLFILVLVALMIPLQVTMVPLYIILQHLGWINTFQGMIIPRATNAFGIFMMRQFFLGLPRELDEAARIDGCSELRIFWRIILPLSRPALASLAVFHFMYNWNDFLWPFIVTTSNNMRTLPAGLAMFMGDHVVQYGILTAGATLAMLPLVVAFLFAQKYFIRGLAFTGLK
jgi:multiple sugar transport system permease protein